MLHIEPLESRQLLSASAHATAKPKPTIPTIPTITNTFIGTFAQAKPTHQSASEFEVTFTNESITGILAGTIQTSETSINPIAGTINSKNAVTLKISNSAGKATTYTGKYNAGNFDITGKYKTDASKGVKPTSGTFVLED